VCGGVQCSYIRQADEQHHAAPADRPSCRWFRSDRISTCDGAVGVPLFMS
jgi:hypothetical protein